MRPDRTLPIVASTARAERSRNLSARGDAVIVEMRGGRCSLYQTLLLMRAENFTGADSFDLEFKNRIGVAESWKTSELLDHRTRHRCGKWVQRVSKQIDLNKVFGARDT